MSSPAYVSSHAPMPQPEVAACPEDGAVLIVSRHASEEAVAPAVVGWQVMRVLATGEHLEVGEVHPRRMDARQCAEARFTNIVGWQKLSATVFAAVVPASKAPPPAAPAPKPRRRANGLRIPLWRT